METLVLGLIRTVKRTRELGAPKDAAKGYRDHLASIREAAARLLGWTGHEIDHLDALFGQVASLYPFGNK
jgi:hypothetical protein